MCISNLPGQLLGSRRDEAGWGQRSQCSSSGSVSGGKGRGIIQKLHSSRKSMLLLRHHTSRALWPLQRRAGRHVQLGPFHPLSNPSHTRSLLPGARHPSGTFLRPSKATQPESFSQVSEVCGNTRKRLRRRVSVLPVTPQLPWGQGGGGNRRGQTEQVSTKGGCFQLGCPGLRPEAPTPSSLVCH